MQSFSSRRAVLRHVFAQKHSQATALGIALLFYSVNALILQWRNLDIFTASNFISLFTVGVYYLMTRSSFYLLLLISILIGILSALLLHRVRIELALRHDRTGIISSLGIVAGIILPGCASCGIGLAAVLGLSSSLAVLPFKGIEISVIAVLLIAIAIGMVAKSMTVHAACKVPHRKK